MIGRVIASARYRGQALSWRAFEGSKPLVHRAGGLAPRAHLLIFGCQRSGTTHLERLFRADPRSTVFGEFSVLSIRPNRTVWRDLSGIVGDLEACTGAYTVSRSLLFSHRALEALDAIPLSRAIWVYRDAEGVVASMLAKWGTNFRAISEGVETDLDGRWELEALWDRIENEADAIAAGPPGSRAWAQDVYGLYWLARNETLFNSGLARDPRVTVLGYHDILHNPSNVVASILRESAIAPTNLRFPLGTRASRASRPRASLFSPTVQARCDELFAELRRTGSQ